MDPGGSGSRGADQDVLPPRRTLGGLLAVLRRRKALVLVPLVVVPVVAFGLSSLQEKLYTASTEALLLRQNLALILNNLPDTAAGTDPVRFAQTQAEVARSRVLAERVVEAAEIPGLTAGTLLRDSVVNPKPNSDLLEFVVTQGEPSLASRLAYTYAVEFSDYRRELDTLALRRANTAINDRIKNENIEPGTPLYNALTARARELALLQSLQPSTTVVLDEAPSDAEQTQPQPARNVALGLFVGLLLGVGLALLRDTRDTRIGSATGIAQQLRLPLLAETGGGDAGAASLALLARTPEDVEPTAVTGLATNLDFVNIGVEARAVLLTSVASDESARHAAADLAVSLAAVGRRVLLADLDIRAVVRSPLVGLGDGPGVTDVMVGRASLRDAIVPVALPKQRGPGALDVLRAGAVPPNPGQLVGSPALAALLTELGRQYEAMVLATAPILEVGDAEALAHRVDALVLVASAGVDRATLDDVRRALATIAIPKLGVIVETGVRARPPSPAAEPARRPTHEDATRAARRPRIDEPKRGRGKRQQPADVLDATPFRSGVPRKREPAVPPPSAVRDD